MNSCAPIPDVAMFPDRALDLRIAELGVIEFESVSTVARRQELMIESLKRHGFEGCASRLTSTCRRRDCDFRSCCAACHFAGRLHRAELLLAETALFTLLRRPFFSFTVVPSMWRLAHDQLHNFSGAAAANLVARALRSRGAMGSFNVELVLCEDGGEAYWAPHVHGVALGADPKALSQAFRAMTVGEKNLRPVLVREIPVCDLAAVLNYASKRVDKVMVRYATDSGKPAWRHLPLRPRYRALLNAWRCDRAVDALHFRVGFKRNGRFLVCT